ncbi:hypothetical protein B0P06_005111 [Clostridium saccharoperbutylacetonicum]|uniref:DUF4179 domain-containing protein n=1 Tax=Clostridium saccharoperbutylacetonicum N1-4(HMT) TaxID=931276 RepID=M1MFC1_9CLOT|nr:hypothetical protein [Clostridium saccharoperbutylacetonicum]AGF56614.1 hypothetical protein Cspa_c28510 [Clostridium saccharoperbutylacetonicum N1-4(HMT)]NRT62635.1 hypothetical protein [Clostridium saccharoperbutylacetonicum]NSB25982.1 hypothetical protein [Clostridium saccharoperbutylacetonicum]NSB45340.1 hypothetical protein [Clostridium saccharoperbutylacetonicum]
MINRKIIKLLSSVLGIALTIGILEMPTLAADNVQATSTYNTTSTLTTDKNYIVGTGGNYEKNGVRISIDSVKATKHKLQVEVSIKCPTPMDDHHMDEFADIIMSYGNNKSSRGSTSYENIDGKTLKITFEKDTRKDYLPEKGILRIDVVIPKYKINAGIETNVDFSDSFKNSFEKALSIDVPDANFTIKNLETNMLGTEITYSAPENQSKDDKYRFSPADTTNLILKAGNNFYELRHSGYSSGGDINSRIITGTCDSEAATYDKLKTQSNLSIIPIISTVTEDQREQIYKDLNKNVKHDQLSKNITDKVNYTKLITFNDKTEGEIYNINRTDTTLKVYCKGTNELESLLLASNMNMYYNFDQTENVHDYYRGNRQIDISKDPKDALGYIVEFNNVDKDKTVEVNFDPIIKFIDKYKLGTEIQINK